MVHGHAQENERRSVGVHEGAASHANYLVIETAVAVQGVDISNICIRPPYEVFLYRMCTTVWLPTALCIASVELFVKAMKQPNAL